MYLPFNEDGFCSQFAEGFGPEQCSSYGGIPCEEVGTGVFGVPYNATNYDALSEMQQFKVMM